MRAVHRRWVMDQGMVVLLALGATSLGPGDLQGARLSEDANALEAWRGVVSGADSGFGNLLSVTVDYAVYAPGAYPGQDPSGSGEYVYAYQLTNEADSTVGAVSFSVGLRDASGGHHFGDDVSAQASGLSPGVRPYLAFEASSSAMWLFADAGDGPVARGENSSVLLVTSPNPPAWNRSQVADGGLSVAPGDLPSPLPEPSSVLLVGLAFYGALVRRAGGRKGMRT